MAIPHIVLTLEVLNAEAFRTLNGTAKQVLLRFLSKRSMVRSKAKKGREAGFFIANNGEIDYSFAEAQGYDGLSPQQFNAALKILKDRGFISVNRPGGFPRVKATYWVHVPDKDETWRVWRKK